VPLLSPGPRNAIHLFVVHGIEEELKMGQTIFYILISAVICVAYFTLVDHYLMDMQGLDYWYLFRK
jgi:uncharacterized membrane protein (DUF106 family)